MKRNNKIMVAAALVGALVLSGPLAAQAGYGTGAIRNFSKSRAVTVSDDYQGGGIHWQVAPGKLFGGGNGQPDIDSVVVPTNSCMRIHTWFDSTYRNYDRRGKTQLWVKVPDGPNEVWLGPVGTCNFYS